MKIEVGKTYLDRRGNKVKIIRHEPGHPLPFVDEESYGYTDYGRFDPAGAEDDSDLVKEAPEGETS